MMLELVHAFEYLGALLDVKDASLNDLHQLVIGLSLIQETAHVISLFSDFPHQPWDTLFAHLVLLGHFSMGGFADEHHFDHSYPVFKAIILELLAHSESLWCTMPTIDFWDLGGIYELLWKLVLVEMSYFLRGLFYFGKKIRVLMGVYGWSFFQDLSPPSCHFNAKGS